MLKTCIVVGLVAMAIAREPLWQPAGPPELHIAYASFVGRIELAPEAPTAVKLTTPDGDVVLVPNRFEAVVAELGGRDVEVEGLLLGMGEHVLLWIEAIHWNRAPDEPSPPLRSRDRKISI